MSGPVTLILGDCYVEMQNLAADSVDSIVADPPYGIAFMGKRWDHGVPSVEIWREALRVLKPGGHLLSFGGARTYHRMACAIEDAGFEIRDQIAWVYGSGFPKSHDVAKSIDKAARGVPHGGSDPTSPNHGRFKGGCSPENQRGQGFGAGPGQFMAEAGERNDRELVDAAREWNGWGTALKPALEPIVLARKPLAGTVAENVLAHGTGALNIDGCRVAGGRWPANIIHDGSEEVIGVFPAEAGAAAPVSGDEPSDVTAGIYGKRERVPGAFHADRGSAARFFYCAKASGSDRNDGLTHLDAKKWEQFQTANGTSGKPSSLSAGRDTRHQNTHPTVKPTLLMRYLCRLVTPPGGLVLDPFMGSGSTGRGAVLEGFRFIGIEREEEYLEFARCRIAAAQKAIPHPTLFDHGETGRISP